GTLEEGNYDGTISNAGTLHYSSTTDQTLAGVISSTGALTKDETSTLTLSAANTYTGATRINAGTLEVDGTLAQTAVTVASGATYDVDATDTVLSIAGAGTIDLTDAALTAGDGNDLIFSGVFNGANTFTKVGSATLTLSGDNSSASYTGRVIIDAGTISISSDSNLGSPDILDADRLTLQGGTLQTTADFTLNTNRGITLSTDGGTINTNTGTTLTYGGVIDGTTAFTKSGDGTLVLSGTNTYTGTTTISAGTLTLDQDSNTTGTVIEDTAAITVNGGILNLADDSETIGALTLTSGSITGTNKTLTGSSYTLNPGADVSVSIAPILAGSGINLTKSEAGTATLSADNTYTGTTTISDGTLIVSNALSSRTISNAGTLTVNGALDDLAEITNTGTYNVNQTDTIKTVSGSGDIVLASTKTLTTGDGGDDIISGDISGGGALEKVGIGVLTLAGTNTYSGATTLTTGDIKLTGTLSDSTIVSIGSSSTFDVDATDTIAGVTGSGILDIAPGITLSVGNSSSAVTFAGTVRTSQVITDGEVTTAFGSLTKVGSESLTVSGAMSRLTALTISEGAFILGGNNIIENF
ncbi:MAG: hypothetical protein EBY59_04670, partial [Proteobacteria bacterium]|nr:hypothetical protein [Pseudomonadota bacterium]